jgi:site-specific DNA-methyltransferase (adenine-specific)
MKTTPCELYHDHFQNYKRYNIPKAQLVLTDIPYNLGVSAYASSPEWYIEGDNKKGESKKAKSQFFLTDKNFNIVEFFHFCSTLLKKEPKERGAAPCMVVFCSYQQQQMITDFSAQYGLKKYIPLTLIKKTSPQVLKANMRIVGATEHAMVLYRDKLPKFNNGGHMVLDWFDYKRDAGIEKIHPTQKPISLLKRFIEIFTDEGDVVIDPCAGSATTLRAAAELNRPSYGFEVSRDFCRLAKEKMLANYQMPLEAIPTASRAIPD